PQEAPHEPGIIRPAEGLLLLGRRRRGRRHSTLRGGPPALPQLRLDLLPAPSRPPEGHEKVIDEIRRLLRDVLPPGDERRDELRHLLAELLDPAVLVREEEGRVAPLGAVAVAGL